jgi:PAS domain S-box-containing protein
MSQSRSDIEARRRETLAEYRILDTEPEAVFDELIELVAQSCRVPMAILSLMDADRQWFKASVGLEVAETPRHIAFCNSVIETGEAMTISDAGADARYRDNPLVTGAPHIRFYSGVPLLAADGSCIGSLAVLDTQPRSLEPDQVRSQKAFAKLAMHSIELRRTRLALEDSLAEQRNLQNRVTEGHQVIDNAHELLNFHLDNMPIALIQLDNKLRVARWSGQAQTLFGWSEQESLGQSLDDLKLIHPEDRDWVNARIGALIEGQADASMTLVNRNLTRSGDARICEWHNSVRFDRDGRLISMLAFATDISGRVHTEEALRLSEERYRHAAEASQAALWDFDMLTGKVTFSEAFRDMLGYERLEDMPDTLEAYMQLMHPEDRERVYRKADRLVAGKIGDRASAEFRLLTQNGEYRWVQSNSKVIRDTEGKAIRRLGSTVDIHKRKVAEEKLKEQAERMRGILEVAGEAIVTIDERAIIETANPATERMFGFSATEMLGQNVRLLMTEPDAARHDNVLARYLETGQARILGSPQKLEARRKDGSVFPIELMVTEVRLSDRRIFTGFIRDITQQEQSRRALEASELRFRAAARATNDVVWELVLETNYLWWSEGLQDRFNYSLEEAGNRLEWWEERVHPDDRERVLSSLASAFESREPEWRAHYRFQRGDGGYAEVRDSAFIVLGEHGQPDRMVGGMKDVTQQRRDRRKLAEQAELLDKARDAIIVTDLDGTVTFWNQGAERIYGWTSAELLGVPVFERIHAGKDTWLHAKHQLLASGGWEGQLSHLRKDGQERKLRCHLTLVKDGDGRPRSILSINTDITDQLALEEQLRHAQRLESIGQLTGGVAHDFNNLLTVIMGNAELLNESLDDNPVLKSFAEMTLSAAHRGAELTNQLLTFARRQSLEPRCLDVLELIFELKPLLERSIPEDIEINISHEPFLWHAEIDPAQLESAVLNLVLNARDAMADGGRLSITLSNSVLDEQYAENHREVEPGQYVEVAVSDTGHGIKPELLRHLFEPFFTTKEKGKGTGLGLPMVYGFIKQSRGHIRVYSEEGVGTTVRMYLPKSPHGAKPEQEVSHSDETPGGSERILLVEDDQLVLDHVGRLLEQLGYQVVTASDGENALELMTAQPSFDLLFTDVVMPGRLKGPDLATEVHRINPDIRILFTSGYTQDVITPEMQSEEDFHLLQKPYRKAELARKLREVLDR